MITNIGAFHLVGIFPDVDFPGFAINVENSTVAPSFYERFFTPQ
jgi:hypothetical protein